MTDSAIFRIEFVLRQGLEKARPLRHYQKARFEFNANEIDSYLFNSLGYNIFHEFNEFPGAQRHQRHRVESEAQDQPGDGHFGRDADAGGGNSAKANLKSTASSACRRSSWRPAPGSHRPAWLRRAAWPHGLERHRPAVGLCLAGAPARGAGLGAADIDRAARRRGAVDQLAAPRKPGRRLRRAESVSWGRSTNRTSGNSP